MLSTEELERLLLESTGWQRYTQDSPIFPDVWLGYLNAPNSRRDLLLEPHLRAPAGVLATAVQKGLRQLTSDHQLAYAGGYVAVRLDLRELLAYVLPLSTDSDEEY